MITTGNDKALFRSIFDDPYENTQRLVYADYLEEIGQSEQAEFIRTTCEKYDPNPFSEKTFPYGVDSSRVIELLKTYRNIWFHEFSNNVCLVPPNDREKRSGGTYLVVRRGFIDEVYCTLETFIGRTETADNPLYYGRDLTVVIPGIAKKLFSSQPVSRVVITNAVIYKSGGNDTFYIGNLGIFPKEYWNQLEELRSRGEAIKAIEAVCLNYGRSLAVTLVDGKCPRIGRLEEDELYIPCNVYKCKECDGSGRIETSMNLPPISPRG